MQIRDLTVVVSLCSDFANKSVCSPYTPPFSGLQLRLHSRVRRIKWKDFWQVYPFSPVLNTAYLLASMSAGMRVSPCHSNPLILWQEKRFFFSLMQLLQLQQSLCEMGIGTNRLFFKDHCSSWVSYCSCPNAQKWQCQWELIVNHYCNERFEILIVTHFLELTWRPGTVKYVCLNTCLISHLCTQRPIS